MKRLKDDAITDASKYYKQRSPKKPTDYTTKLQMKKMVEDLESEIGKSYKFGYLVLKWWANYNNF